MSGLACRELTVSPGADPVLRGLSLEVPAGSLTALVGPSGAGKTTLLRAVAGLERLDAGEVWLGDRRLDGVAPHRRRIAVVFQEPRLLPHLSVEDNVALPLRAAGRPREERRTRAQGGLEEVGLGDFADRRVRGLSGGEQQRVAVARALCAEPDLLMLDEPLVALDPNRREDLRRLIARVQAERRLTTLVITHDRAEAAELGERVALMLEGRIVQHDEPRALFERPGSEAVARFFGVPVVPGEAVGAGPGTFAIRPEHVELASDGPLRATVLEAVYTGAHVRLTLALEGAGTGPEDRGTPPAGQGPKLEAWVAPARAPRAGERIGVTLPAERLWRLPG